jgi:hypothetical protein
MLEEIINQFYIMFFGIKYKQKLIYFFFFEKQILNSSLEWPIMSPLVLSQLINTDNVRLNIFA